MPDATVVGLAVTRGSQRGRAEVLLEFDGKQVSAIYGRYFSMTQRASLLLRR